MKVYGRSVPTERRGTAATPCSEKVQLESLVSEN